MKTRSILLLFLCLIGFFNFSYSQYGSKVKITPKKKVTSTTSNFSNSSETEVKGNVYAMVDVPAEYSAGKAALDKFIQSTLVYPSLALKNKTEGVVILKFIVEPNGSISGTEVLLDIGDGCGNAAATALNQSKNWIPGKINGKAVRSTANYFVSFKLPK